MSSAITRAAREAHDKEALARELYNLIVKQSKALGQDVPAGVRPPVATSARPPRQAH